MGAHQKCLCRYIRRNYVWSIIQEEFHLTFPCDAKIPLSFQSNIRSQSVHSATSRGTLPTHSETSWLRSNVEAT